MVYIAGKIVSCVCVDDILSPIRVSVLDKGEKLHVLNIFDNTEIIKKSRQDVWNYPQIFMILKNIRILKNMHLRL